MLDSFIAIDIETTGLNPNQDRIIEIGAVKVIDARITEEFSSLINPLVPISNMISSLTGITNNMIKSAPSTKMVLEDLLEFVGDYPLLGHNIIFDYSFLKINYAKLGIPFERNGIDTLKISRSLHKKLESKSLGSMCNYYNIENKNAHRAFDDAKAAYELYNKLRNEFEKKNPEIFHEEQLIYKIKKIEQITPRQKNYLIDLTKYHKIENVQPVKDMSKSEASTLIDRIILTYGRIL